MDITCDICGVDRPKFFKYVNFREHYWATHKLCEKKYKCEEKECGGGFWLKRAKHINFYIRHQWELKVKKRRTDEFTCEMCGEGKKFKEERALISHKIRMHAFEGFKCDKFGKSFDVRGK